MNIRARFLLFAAIEFSALLFSHVSIAQQFPSIDASRILTTRYGSSITNPLPNAEYYAIDSATLVGELGTAQHIQLTNFPGAIGERVTLDLKPAKSAIDSRTTCIMESASGTVRVPIPELTMYRGVVVGEPHSRVIMSVMNGMLLCSILRESGVEYVLGPEKNNLARGNHIFMAETDLLATGPFHPFTCFNDDMVQPNAPTPIEDVRAHFAKHSSPSGFDAIQSTSTLLETEVAVEADSCFYGATGGNMKAALGYIGAMFSMSSAIYEDEVNMIMHLTWVKVWTANDPYQVKGNAYALEDTVANYWKLHYDTVQRDLAHILTSIGYGGGGYGYFSICDPNYSYSMSSPQTGHQYPTFAFTYDAYIVSHEMGHNFSLPHTHTCYWDPPLDTCYTKDDPVLHLADACDSLPIKPRMNPGSIMSYCANANYSLSGNNFAYFTLLMTFTHRVDSVLRANAEMAKCVIPPADPTVILLNPRGSETYPGDTNLTLLWTSANVQSVALSYSSDAGSSWNPIASGVPATSAAYPWKVPNTTSQKMLVRIQGESGANPPADTSLLFFAVNQVLSVNATAESTNFSVMPNPAHSSITLVSSTDVGKVQCEIVNEIGVVCQKLSSALSKNAGVTIDVHTLGTGKYFLRVTDKAASVHTIPFIVE